MMAKRKRRKGGVPKPPPKIGAPNTPIENSGRGKPRCFPAGRRKPRRKSGRRKTRLAFSAWIERNVALPQGLTAEPGPIVLAPYMREIADAIGDPSIERVTVLKSARVGTRRCSHRRLRTM